MTPAPRRRERPRRGALPRGTPESRAARAGRRVDALAGPGRKRFHTGLVELRGSQASYMGAVAGYGGARVSGLPAAALERHELGLPAEWQHVRARAGMRARRDALCRAPHVRWSLDVHQGGSWAHG